MPTGGAGQGERPGGESLPPPPGLSSTSQRVTAIVEAVERAAAGILDDAETEARRYVDESRRNSDRAAAERIRAVAELTESLVDRAETLRGQLETLVSALDNARAQLEEAAGVGGEAHLQPAPPVREQPPPEPAPESPAPSRLRSVQPDGDAAERGEDPSTGKPEEEDPSTGKLSLSGARLLAIQMAVAGSSRSQIETRLKGELGVEDASRILDAVLGSEEE